MNNNSTKNIKFDEGFATYCINGDPDRVISVNLADTSIVDRINIALEAIEKNANRFDFEKAETADELIEMHREMDKFVRNQIDYIFNNSISDMVFGAQSCISTVKGEPLYARFLESIVPEIEKSFNIERKKMSQKAQGYVNATKQYSKNRSYKNRGRK